MKMVCRVTTTVRLLARSVPMESTEIESDGKPMYDASTGGVLSGYGPLSTVTKSDYYGNQGYYIFPNLLPGNYPLRFTMPEEYNDYGLTMGDWKESRCVRRHAGADTG